MEIDWQAVSRVLVIRLRSIGDTVLTTPSMIELRRLLPNARIDILLEDWVAPVLQGFDYCDNVIAFDGSTSGKISTARRIRKTKYDVVFNFHGGSTSSLLTRASGARFRLGYKSYRNGCVYTHRFPPPAEYWKRSGTHSAEQQLALLGFAGLDIKDCPATELNVSETAKHAVELRLSTILDSSSVRKIALVHPVAAYDTKQWSAKKFADVVTYLRSIKIEPVLVSTEAEKHVIAAVEREVGNRIAFLTGLSLPEVTALAHRSSLFVGNDSGIAHIAAAVKTPSVVIFGSSNREHWRPWTDSINEIVYREMECQPCPGDFCREFDQPACIIGIEVADVISAIRTVVDESGTEAV
jgi:ADP-heptose:LPS heptosyltransferase